MDREPGEARFCAECNKWHSAEEGDLWAESSMLGLRITYFAFMDGKVFDITGNTLASTLSDLYGVHMLCAGVQITETHVPMFPQSGQAVSV